MARKVTIDTGRALAEYGVVGANKQFELGEGPLQPTIVVADISRTIAGEFVEPRAVVGATINNVGSVSFGDAPVLELVCVSEGGLVIEDLRLSTVQLGGGKSFTNQAEGAWLFVVRGASFLPAEVPADPGVRVEIFPVVVGVPAANVGSIPVRSFVNKGTMAVGQQNLHGLTDNDVWLGPNFQLAPGQRWFIPPGAQAYFYFNSDNAAAVPIGNVQLTWRELLGRGSPQAGTN